MKKDGLTMELILPTQEEIDEDNLEPLITVTLDDLEYTDFDMYDLLKEQVNEPDDIDVIESWFNAWIERLKND